MNLKKLHDMAGGRDRLPEISLRIMRHFSPKHCCLSNNVNKEKNSQAENYKKFGKKCSTLIQLTGAMPQNI